MATEAELKQLRKLFAEIDEDGSGLLDRDEVYELAEKLGATLSTAELDEAMAEMDEDGSGEVDFDEFAEWFAAAKQRGGSKWVDALNNKLGEYQKETEAFMATLNDGNTDGALGNLNQLLSELPGEEDSAELRRAMDNVFTPICDVQAATGDGRSYTKVTDEQWAAVVKNARDRAIARMEHVPTKYLLVYGIPEDVKVSRVEGLVKNLKHRPKFVDWGDDEEQRAKDMYLEFERESWAEQGLQAIQKDLRVFGITGSVQYVSDRLLLTGADLTAASVRAAIGHQPLEIRLSQDETFARVLMAGAAEAVAVHRRILRDQGVDEVELKQLFCQIDEDDSGLLDREEVAALSEQLGVTLTKVKLDAAMADMDEDGSGEVDFDEFKEWWARSKDLIKSVAFCASNDLVVFATEEGQAVPLSRVENAVKNFDERMAGTLESVRPLITVAKNVPLPGKQKKKTFTLGDADIQKKSNIPAVSIVIQRYARGCMARWQVRRMRQAMQEAAEAEAAAVRIQSVARGNALRKQLEEEQLRKNRLEAERLQQAKLCEDELNENELERRRAEDEAEAARRRAEEEAARLRREMERARRQAEELAAAEREEEERRRQAARKQQELAENKRLLAVATQSVRALQPTALTYVVVSYVFPEDVVRVSYVSGTKQWIAWEMPFASVLARRSSDAIYALYRAEDLHYLIGVDVVQWQALLKQREMALASDRAWDLDHMPNAHPPMMPQPMISTRPASAPTWTNSTARAGPDAVVPEAEALRVGSGIRYESTTTPGDQVPMSSQPHGGACRSQAHRGAGRSRSARTYRSVTQVGDVEGATVVAMYNEMIKEERREASICAEAAHRNELLVLGQEVGPTTVNKDAEEPKAATPSSSSTSTSRNYRRPVTAPASPRNRSNGHMHALQTAQQRAANSVFDANRVSHTRTPRSASARHSRPPLGESSHIGNQQQQQQEQQQYQQRVQQVVEESENQAAAQGSRGVFRTHAGSTDIDNDRPLSNTAVGRRPATAGPTMRFFRASGTGRLLGEGYDAGFTASVRNAATAIGTQTRPGSSSSGLKGAPESMTTTCFNRSRSPSPPTRRRGGSCSTRQPYRGRGGTSPGQASARTGLAGWVAPGQAGVTRSQLRQNAAHRANTARPGTAYIPRAAFSTDAAPSTSCSASARARPQTAGSVLMSPRRGRRIARHKVVAGGIAAWSEA